MVPSKVLDGVYTPSQEMSGERSLELYALQPDNHCVYRAWFIAGDGHIHTCQEPWGLLYVYCRKAAGPCFADSDIVLLRGMFRCHTYSYSKWDLRPDVPRCTIQLSSTQHVPWQPLWYVSRPDNFRIDARTLRKVYTKPPNGKIHILNPPSCVSPVVEI